MKEERGRKEGDEEGEAGEGSGRKAEAGQWRGKEAPALESFSPPSICKASYFGKICRSLNSTENK